MHPLCVDPEEDVIKGNGNQNPVCRSCEGTPSSFLQRCCPCDRGQGCHTSPGCCTQRFCEPDITWMMYPTVDGPAVHADP